MAGDETGKPTTSPIDPASPREQLRSWLQWLPAWFLIPLGLSQGHTPQAGPNSGHEQGYGGPHDTPGHQGGGYGDYGGGDPGGGGLGGV